MTFRTLDDLKPAPGLKALVRVDFNVPMDGGHVSDETRLKAALPTIRDLTAAGAKVILIAHFDRPKGKRVPEMSLKPILDDLSALVGDLAEVYQPVAEDAGHRLTYGVAEGLISSFPVTCSGGEYSIVQGLEIDEFSRGRIDTTVAELAEERDAVKGLGLI